jgi:succinyl-CoA synthetase beta subunit
MRIHEYQAKALFTRYGILTPIGFVAEDSKVVGLRAKCMVRRLAVKAQVHSGGRWKNGAVRIVQSVQEAKAAAAELLGSTFRSNQTGVRGKPIRSVLVEEALEVVSEKYLSIVIDRQSASPILFASPTAGVEVESIRPFKFLLSFADGAWDLSDQQVREAAYKLTLTESLADEGVRLIRNLLKLFFEKDCVLLEINPLAVTRGGRLVVLDAKIEFDDNGLFRHPELASLRDSEQEGVIAVGKTGVPFVRLEGNIGLIVNGAGLAMATMDGLGLHGGKAANFLDIGGRVTTEDVEEAMGLLLREEGIRAILIHVFGGIVKCDRVAEGLLRALGRMSVSVPVVVRFAGTNSAEGLELLKMSGSNFIAAESFGEAVKTAAASARHKQ